MVGVMTPWHNRAMNTYGVQHFPATTVRPERWYISKGRRTIGQGFDSREAAEERAAQMNFAADANTSIAALPTTATPATALPVPEKLAAGWSNASRGARGNDHGVGALLGLTSSATGFDCHYCGLDYRTCDCR